MLSGVNWGLWPTILCTTQPHFTISFSSCQSFYKVWSAHCRIQIAALWEWQGSYRPTLHPTKWVSVEILFFFGYKFLVQQVRPSICCTTITPAVVCVYQKLRWCYFLGWEKQLKTKKRKLELHENHISLMKWTTHIFSLNLMTEHN